MHSRPDTIPSARRAPPCSPLALLLALAAAAIAPAPGMASPGNDARIYRCTAPDGSVEFRQHPCRNADSSERIRIDDRPSGWTPPSAAAHTPGSKKPARSATRHAPGAGRSGRAGDACWNKRRQLEDVNWQLRRGYTADQGVKLRRRRRQYEDYIRHRCDGGDAD